MCANAELQSVMLISAEENYDLRSTECNLVIQGRTDIGSIVGRNDQE